MKTPQTIKLLLKNKKMSQKELAKKIGKSETAVSQLLNGDYSPSPKTMDKIAEALNVPVPIINYLSLDESDIPKNKKEIFKILNPSVEKLINEIFDFEMQPTNK